ncbi:atrial natriuretic peptide receptor [Elysia marginata]|uniref:Atrial natriuretic peptide receptor n=1 Tax=Elysia marginata TaxID=1093978 RepID=A0AAV4FA60_9GAST|nr:atrial natriuretic peptide receptor [Elysia marginata]
MADREARETEDTNPAQHVSSLVRFEKTGEYYEWCAKCLDTPNSGVHEKDSQPAFRLPLENSVLILQCHNLSTSRSRQSSLSPKTPSFLPVPSKHSMLRLTTVVLLLAFLVLENSFTHAQPTYSIPETNTSGKGTVVDIPGGSVGKNVPVFSIANPGSSPTPIVQRPLTKPKKISWPTDVKIGVLLPRLSNLDNVLYQPLYAMEYNLPAIECAVDDVTSTRGIIPLGVKVKVTTPSRPLQLPSNAPMEAFEMTYDRRAHVLFGPYDIWPAAQINRYAMKWNVPVLTTSGLMFPPRNPFMQTTRMQASFTKLGQAVHRMIRHFNYTVIGVAYETSGKGDRDSPFLHILRPLYALFQTVTFEPPHEKIASRNADMGKILMSLKDASRIVVVVVVATAAEAAVVIVVMVVVVVTAAARVAAL